MLTFMELVEQRVGKPMYLGKRTVTEVFKGEPAIKFKKSETAHGDVTYLFTVDNPSKPADPFELKVSFTSWPSEELYDMLDGRQANAINDCAFGHKMSGYEIDFSVNRSYSLTNRFGSQSFRVFTRVVQATNQFVRQHKPDILWFSAYKDSRVKLYNFLFRRLSNWRSVGVKGEWRVYGTEALHQCLRINKAKAKRQNRKPV